MSLADELQRLGIVVGRIVAVADHPGARAPAYLLTIDTGGDSRHECSVPRADYSPADLEGTQVVCGRDGDDVVVLAAHSHASGLVLLRPEREVEDGSVVA